MRLGGNSLGYFWGLFLWHGITLAFFQSSETRPWLRDAWKISVSKGAIRSVVSFSSLGWMLSEPNALWASKHSNSFCTPTRSMFSGEISGIGSLSIVGSEVRSSLVNTVEK